LRAILQAVLGAVLGAVLRAAVLGAALAAPAAAAETARVRSGEHDGFTRLVVELPAAAGWRLGRRPSGYGLRVARPGLDYELSGAFRLISRARVAALSDGGGGHLEIALACRCHATAVDFGASWVVIDIRDGPAPVDSPFEVALEAPGFGAEEPADRGAAVQAAATKPPPPAPGPAAASIAAPWDPAWRGLTLSPAIPAPSPTTAGTLAPGAGSGIAPALETADVAAPSRPPLDGEEALLLQELSRAASQGLLEADVPWLERARDAAAGEAAAAKAPPDEAGTAPAEPAQMAAASEAFADPAPAPDPAGHVRLEVESSIDRDAGAATPRARATAEGVACLPDSLFDLAGWGGSEAPARGLAARHAALVGEFDRPDPAAVLGLVRYYLSLGFGAEARATLAAFAVDDPSAEVLGLIAGIVDGVPEGLPGRLGGQAGCPGRAALWSVLAEGGVPPPEADTRAIVAAFSALPLHLRRHLGPGLAEGFLARGDRATATTLRNAIARAPGEHGDAFALLEARLALERGDPGAPAALERLAGGEDAAAAAAYATFLAGELAAGQAPERGADTAAALAFERAGTAEGEALAVLAVRARLAEGAFAQALDEIRRIEADGDNGERGTAEAGRSDAGGGKAGGGKAGGGGAGGGDTGGGDTGGGDTGGGDTAELWSAFADALARGAQDGPFLRLAFAARDRLAEADLSAPVAAALARRMTGLGFAEEALRYLPAESEDEATRFARAEALIATGSAAAAYGALAPLSGPAADRLRAEARAALGDARGAARLFAAAGDAVSADRAALAAGAWDLLAGSADPELRALAARRLAPEAGAGRLEGDTPETGAAEPEAPESGAPESRAPETGAAEVGAAGTDALQTDALRTDALQTGAAFAPGLAPPEAAQVPAAQDAAPMPPGRVGAARAALAAAEAARRSAEALLGPLAPAGAAPPGTGGEGTP
jgi:hypothetical protein